VAAAAAALLVALLLPAAAFAHGPVATLDSDYLARVGHVPAGLPAKVVDGDQRMWDAGAPSIVWFWPIVMLLLCVLAARGVRRPSLDARLARGLAVVALAAVAAASCRRQLHGRSAVGAFAVIELVVILALVAWGLSLVLRARADALTLFLVALVAIGEGITLLPALLDGFVLMALPAFVARAAGVVCLGAGLGVLLLAFRIFEGSGAGGGRRGRRATVGASLLALLLAGCGSSAAPSSSLPAALVAQARPIGQGARFRPPARGTVLGACRAGLGRRYGVHVELFAADRVVLVAAGIGARGPLHWFDGRISSARCYGDLVTVEPTGVVLVRPGARLTVAALFRAWGQPLTARRLASFTGSGVRVFVGARRWPGPPGSVPLTRHAEIVLEIGPMVPPHSTYTFPPGV